MPLKVALQMDPIGSVNINADSTFRIALEAQARGHSLFFYTPDRLAFVEGRVMARGWPIELRREVGNHVSYGDEIEVDLADFDVVWLRQDPPFDMGYITTTHLLDMIHPKTLVVNDPFWVRNYPEKLLVLRFPDLTPPTTIARDLADDPGLQGAAWRHHPEAALRQRRRGRVPAGPERPQPVPPARAVHRHEPRAADRAEVPARRVQGRQADHSGRWRAGGRDQPGAAGGRDAVEHACRRAAREGRADRRAIWRSARAIGPVLREKGQVFVGIDVIGDWLTEINVTSPTGIQELERFDGTNTAARIWEVIEAKRAG